MSENMNEYDESISVDSEEDDDSESASLPDRGAFSQNGKRFSSDAERRAHHNALERKRRDHIKECFNQLRDSVPSLQNEKPSRAQILKKAADYIQVMQQRKENHERDIAYLQQQIRELERMENDFAAVDSPEVKVDSESDDDDDNMNPNKKF